ncbi:MAG: hypothetical protein R3348_05130 [Xanthomonadales bacterium]|nr:hypothetical protein [Xanthomonadales bacterium]
MTLLCPVLPGLGSASEIRIDTRSMRIEFSAEGDLLSIESCLPDCSSGNAQRQVLGSYRGLATLSRDSDGLFRFARRDGDYSIELEFEHLPSGERRLWRVPHRGYLLGLDVTRPQSLTIAADLEGPPAAGFTGWLQRSRYIAFNGRRTAMAANRGPVVIGDGSWVGLEGRFWVVLVRPEQPASTHFREFDGATTLQADLEPASAAPHRYTFYAGPRLAKPLAGLGDGLESLAFAEFGPLVAAPSRWLNQAVGWVSERPPGAAGALVLLAALLFLGAVLLSRPKDRLRSGLAVTALLLVVAVVAATVAASPYLLSAVRTGLGDLSRPDVMLLGRPGLPAILGLLTALAMAPSLSGRAAVFTARGPVYRVAVVIVVTLVCWTLPAALMLVLVGATAAILAWQIATRDSPRSTDQRLRPEL